MVAQGRQLAIASVFIKKNKKNKKNKEQRDDSGGEEW